MHEDNLSLFFAVTILYEKRVRYNGYPLAGPFYYDIVEMAWPLASLEVRPVVVSKQ